MELFRRGRGVCHTCEGANEKCTFENCFSFLIEIARSLLFAHCFSCLSLLPGVFLFGVLIHFSLYLIDRELKMPTLFGNGPAKIVTVLGFSDTVGGFAPGLRLAAFSASSPQSDLSSVTHAQHAYHLSFHLIQSSLSFPKKLSLVSLSLPHHSEQRQCMNLGC